MIRKATMALAATLVLGSASLALADDYTDQAADAIRNYGPVAQQHQALTTRQVSQQAPQAQGTFSVENNWMERASQNSGF